MYFRWNIISLQNKVFSLLFYRITGCHWWKQFDRNRNRNVAKNIVSTTSLRFMFYGNVKTITGEEKYEEKKVIFFHLMLNNITHDSEGRWKKEKVDISRRRKRKEERKINQNVLTSFFESNDWKLIVDNSERWNKSISSQLNMFCRLSVLSLLA